MSSKQKDGLPTAAYSFIVEEAQLDPDENHRVVKWSDPRESDSIEGIRHQEHTIRNVEELVRRKDVAQLIQDKIEDLDDKISRKEYLSNDEPEKEAVRVLGELLDEVKGQ